MGALRLLGRWYILGPLLAGLGVLISATVFFFWVPGKPQVGVINTGLFNINRQTAFTLGAMLDFAREEDSIKAVVVNLNTGGGTVAPSEHLFLKLLDLREKKPVVIAVDEFAASGGYLMSMGANFIFVKPSSIVGSVGVIIDKRAFDDTPLSEERSVGTGPSKARSTPREFYELLEILKESFAKVVVTHRGDKLRISPEELVEANVYTGMEAVRMGLVDAIGDDTDAIRKAADLADIKNYSLVDVNVEVFRIFNQKFRRVIDPLLETGQEDLALSGMTPFLPFLLAEEHDGEEGEETPGPPDDFNLPIFRYQYVSPSE